MTRPATMTWGWLLLLVGLEASVTPASAQITVPLVPIFASGTSTLPLSAAEGAYHVSAQEERAKNEISFRRALPMDSINTVVAATGQRWLSQINASPVQGIQLDPSGRVGVVARQEEYAKRQIATRLATRGLSFADRAFTYLTAVQAFTNQYHPERLPTAEVYLNALDAMGDSAAAWQFLARLSLVETYYHLGVSADVVRHGTRAIQLVGLMPFPDRSVMFPGGKQLYVLTTEVLAGQPKGRARIEQLNAILRAAIVPPPALVALDPWFAATQGYYEMVLAECLHASERLGQKGGDIVGTHWLNNGATDSSIMSVNDGKIRVVEVGTYGCPPCIFALYMLERLHQRFPDVGMVMATFTGGAWGNRLIEPGEEVAKLTDYFLNVMKVTIPIGIWAPKKVVNEDGGLTPENNNPIWKSYPYVNKPTLWVLDGTGTIRQVVSGYSIEAEGQIARTVQFLQREAAAATH